MNEKIDESSILGFPPLDLGECRPLSPDDDLLGEMLAPKQSCESQMTPDQYTIALGMDEERFCAVCRHPVPGHELNCPVLLQEPQHEGASQTVEEIRRLRQMVANQTRYIEQLEKQLEPEVIAEIRAELEELPE
jgi:hypothetical protein